MVPEVVAPAVFFRKLSCSSFSEAFRVFGRCSLGRILFENLELGYLCLKYSRGRSTPTQERQTVVITMMIMIAFSEVSSLLSGKQSCKRWNDRYYRKNTPFHKQNKIWREKKSTNCLLSSCRISLHIYNLHGPYLYNISTWLLKILRNHFQLNCQHIPVAVSLV